MSSSKVIHAFYNDDEVVLDAVKKVKAANHHIEEVFCPFPVHGLDKAMGLAPTRIAITSFMYTSRSLYYVSFMGVLSNSDLLPLHSKNRSHAKQK